MGSGKNKIIGRVNYHVVKDYKTFCAANPTVILTKQQFSAIIVQSNKLIARAILDNPYGYKLPNHLGYIAVDKYKPTPNKKTGKVKKPVDWQNTNKYGKLIYLTNFHSLGWIHRVRLYKNPHTVNLDCYVFKAHRLLKRTLAALIFTGKLYQHLDRNFFSRRFSIDKIFKQK